MPVKFGELTNLDCFLLPADADNTKHNDSLDAMNYDVVPAVWAIDPS